MHGFEDGQIARLEETTGPFPLFFVLTVVEIIVCAPLRKIAGATLLSIDLADLVCFKL